MVEGTIWKTFVKSKYATTPNSKLIETIPIFSFGTMGIVALLNPQYIADIAGYTKGILGVDGKNEIRAVYGGFGIFIATLLYFSKDTNLEIGVKLTVSSSLLGMASGRIISVIMDKQINMMSAIFGCSEVILAAMILRGFAHQTIIKQIKSL